MRSTQHMGKTITLFPIPMLVRIKAVSGPGEHLLRMIYKAFDKRRRIEYFKAQERRKKRASLRKKSQ